MFQRVDAIETSGSDGKAFAMRYGASADRMFFTTHAIDVRHFADGSTLTTSERDRLRASYGLRGVSFAYVGRLWWGKGLSQLLEAFEEVQGELPDQVKSSPRRRRSGGTEAQTQMRC